MVNQLLHHTGNTIPIPHDKDEVATCTAMAGKCRFKINFYGRRKWATNPISEKMIESCRNNVELPIIIGGGIDSAEKAISNCKAGVTLLLLVTL